MICLEVSEVEKDIHGAVLYLYMYLYALLQVTTPRYSRDFSGRRLQAAKIVRHARTAAFWVEQIYLRAIVLGQRMWHSCILSTQAREKRMQTLMQMLLSDVVG